MTHDLPTPDVLTVYGASWCSDCRNTRRYLDSTSVPYRYVDLGTDDAAQALLDRAGYRAIPVVITTGGKGLHRAFRAGSGRCRGDPRRLIGVPTYRRFVIQHTAIGRDPALGSGPMFELLETSQACRKIPSIS